MSDSESVDRDLSVGFEGSGGGKEECQFARF